MKSYLDIVRNVLDNGFLQPNRTGVSAYTIPGAMFSHDMADGFPLLTTKRVPFRLVASELEFFIKGLTDKKWLQERNNHIWDSWSDPLGVPPWLGADEAKSLLKHNKDLGPIYGRQWRRFGSEYKNCKTFPLTGIDQLANVVEKLKRDPQSRRMLVSAWNPVDESRMALPPCHFAWQVTVVNNKLNLMWSQRSVDVALGLPFNIASYGLLLHLLSLESGYEPGKLIGFLADTHIYENHVDGLKLQLSREPKTLCRIETPEFSSIFGWEYTDTHTVDYVAHDKIEFEIAV